LTLELDGLTNNTKYICPNPDNSYRTGTILLEETVKDVISLDDLKDVSLSGVVNNEVLKYDETLQKWTNQVDTGSGTLAGLSDVTLTSVSDSNLLQFDNVSGVWKNADFIDNIILDDSTVKFRNITDPTKEARFDLDQMTTGNLLKMKVPLNVGSSMTIVSEDDEQFLSKKQITDDLRIGDSNPITGSSVLEVVSTTKGSITGPKMTNAEKLLIPAPVSGLSVYNTTTDNKEFFNGTTWEKYNVPRYASIYVSTPVATPFANALEWTLLNMTTTSSFFSIETSITNGRIQYTGSKARIFKIEATLTISNGGGVKIITQACFVSSD
jgi:hypothetical protein